MPPRDVLGIPTYTSTHTSARRIHIALNWMSREPMSACVRSGAEKGVWYFLCPENDEEARIDSRGVASAGLTPTGPYVKKASHPNSALSRICGTTMSSLNRLLCR